MKRKSIFYRITVLATIILAVCSVGTAAFDTSPTKFIYSPYDFGLKDYYAPLKSMSMDTVYEQLREEYPDEIPVVMPREPKGKTEIFVSPEGNDYSGRGTKEEPYKTVQKALRHARKLKFAQKSAGVVIWLRGGVYTLEQGIDFDGQDGGTKDCPLFISAYNDEDVTISGATVLDKDDFGAVTDNNIRSRLQADAVDKVIVADLKEKGVEEYGGVNLTTGNYPTEKEVKIYWDDTLMNMARYPNYGSIAVGHVIDTGPISMIDGTILNGFVDDGRGFEFELKDTRPLTWKNTGDIYMDGKMYWEWRPGIYRVRAFNSETKSVRSENYSLYGVRESPLTNYYFFNVLEELDSPGEWFIDKETGKLYVYPFDGGIGDSKVSFSIGEFDLCSLKNAKHIYFNGIKFKYNSASGISLENCEDVVVQDCDVSFMGKYGLYMKGCKYSGTTTSLYYNCSDALIRIYPRDDNYYQKNGIPTRNFIQNCYIGRQGITDHSAGIYGGDVGMIISHNLLQKFAAAAMTPLGFETIVEYNEVTGAPYEVEDMGAFYAGDLSQNTFTQVRFNYFHDTSALYKMAQTVYLDGFGSLYAVYGNVMKNIPAALKSHTGIKNMWVNNVITENSYKDATAIDLPLSYYRQGNLFWPSYILDKWNGLLGYHFRGYENFSDAFHAARYPQLYEYLNGTYKYIERKDDEGYTRDDLEEELRTPGGYYFKNNVSYKHTEFKFPEISYPTMIGYEENWAAMDENPGFVDFENGNLNFKEDAEVYKKLPEFEAPPFDKMGLITEGTRWEHFKPSKAPKLINPVNGSSGTETYDSVTFAWENTMGINRYRLIVARDEEFQDIIYDKELDLANAKLEMPEIGGTYYWKVIAMPMVKSFDMENLESNVGMFTVMTYDEMLKNCNADTQYLDQEIENTISLAENITEGEEAGCYNPGTKQKLLEAAEEYREISNTPNIQPDIDKAITALKKRVFEIRENVVTGIKPLMKFDSESWHTTNGTPSDALDVHDGIVVLDGTAEKQQSIKHDEKMQLGIMYSFRAKIDSTDGWMVFGNYEKPDSAFTSMNSYCAVITASAIELQKYTPDRSYYIINSTPNDGIVNSGEWHEYAYGLLPDSEGIRFVLMIDGKTIINYIDTNNPLYIEGYPVVLANPANKTVSLTKSEMTYDKVPQREEHEN